MPILPSAVAPARTPTRRTLLQASAYAGISFMFRPGIARTYAANEKLRMACVGAGGQASGGVSTALGQHLVAVAEVDQGNRGAASLKQVMEKSPDTRIYSDYRRMFDEHPQLDAVWVGCPDHNHFSASIRALHCGAGVYCEKPLTWSIWEARKLREVAMEKRLPTQMGNQGHSSESIRLICEHLWAGHLGEVREAHMICNRRFTAGDSRPASKPVPQGLDFEAWLGPAPQRDFHDGLHSFSWRGWLDFGTGSLGDMGCHNIDGACWALKLHEAASFEVEALQGKNTRQGHAPEAVIRYSFPARADLPPCTMTWYHGGKKAPRPAGMEEGRPLLGEGLYLVGSKGLLSSGSHCQDTQLIPKTLHASTPTPPKLLPRSKHGHGGDFIQACKAKDPLLPSSNFDYAARLTEIVLAGNLALAVGEKLTYSMKDGRTNLESANALLKRTPRAGWEAGYEG